MAAKPSLSVVPTLHRNDVSLVGRLAAAADERLLPSGDVVVSFRVNVERPPDRSGRPGVDSLPCVAWRGDVRRVVLGWTPGDTVQVSGSLRRRFWRGPGGSRSRIELEVSRAKRVARAPSV